MGFKPIPTSLFIKWLKKRGIVYIRKESSHHIYDYPKGSGKSLDRPVVIRPKYKDIPPCHIHTNLQTIGVDYKTFQKEIQLL